MKNMTDEECARIVHTPNGDRRKLFISQCVGLGDSHILSENAFGEVMWREDSGNLIPFNCTHGGSMWLCRSCAATILDGKWADL